VGAEKRKRLYVVHEKEKVKHNIKQKWIYAKRMNSQERNVAQKSTDRF
jgi:hypothetical protein